MQEKALRDIFGEELRELGRENEKIVVLDADLANATRTALFKEEFPDRFFNIGIAEANMVSVAAGLSTCGFIPFAATFGFLLALRAADPIRSQLCYPNLNVKLVGGNGGLTGHGDGATHQTTTDLAIMSSMPNMKVIVPSDKHTLRWALKTAADVKGPVYIRIPREAAPVLHHEEDCFEFGKAILHRDGKDLTIISMGLMLEPALNAASLLEKEGLSAAVLEILTLKPLDKNAIIEQANKTGAIITAEEHSRYGGLFSMVSQTVVETQPVPVLSVAVNDRFGETGEYRQLLDACGLNVEHILEQAHKIISMKTI